MREARKQPFCWQSKPALRKIRELCGNTGDGASTIAVYVGLTEIASDNESDRFQTTQEYIARKACLGIRTVRGKLKVLEKAGLIKVDIPELRAPGFYELLQFGNDRPTIGNKRRAFGNSRKQASLPPLEESTKKKENQKPKELSSNPDVQSWRSDL